MKKKDICNCGKLSCHICGSFNSMKRLLFIVLIFTLFSCEDSKEVYETSIKTYVISSKELQNNLRGGDTYYLYFQTSKSTESAKVDYDTYSKYKVGDTIQVLIKWWEKPKNLKKSKNR